MFTKRRARARSALAAAVVIAAALVAATTPLISARALLAAGNENGRTLVLSLPGPFNGCSALAPGANATTNAVLDLIRPSAFLTNGNGTLVGEGGAIASAELTSLQPETVRYTIAPNQKWGNGDPFTGGDLVQWWQRAKRLASVVSDGYRAIKSLTVSGQGLVITAIFATPYADWDQLFRDVGAPNSPAGCALSNLLDEPSLGPYTVSAASASRIVLTLNPHWPLDANRFGRLVITSALTLPTKPSDLFAQYVGSAPESQVQAVSSDPWLSSHIGSSSSIEEMTFAPRRRWTSELAVRQALSWSVNRQGIIDDLFGAVTFTPSPAASAIYSQGQGAYPGSGGPGPDNQTTTTVPPANTLADCVSCALLALRQHGFVRGRTGWLNGSGQVLSINLAVGPTALDRGVASRVVRDWSAIGITTHESYPPSDIAASLLSASSHVDVSIFGRPTSSSPALTARSWVGPPYRDSYSSGVRSSGFTSLYNQALAIFNPVTASATWLNLDQLVMTDFWVRPFFTPPTFLVWSTSLATVAGSDSVVGFVDQVPTWTVTSPSGSTP